MQPTIQEYRLAAWYRKFHEAREKADAFTEKGIEHDMNGYYERSNSAFRRASEYNHEADGMLDALYALGFSESQVEEARLNIENFLKGE